MYSFFSVGLCPDQHTRVVDARAIVAILFENQHWYASRYRTLEKGTPTSSPPSKWQRWFSIKYNHIRWFAKAFRSAPQIDQKSNEKTVQSQQQLRNAWGARQANVFKWKWHRYQQSSCASSWQWRQRRQSWHICNINVCQFNGQNWGTVGVFQ